MLEVVAAVDAGDAERVRELVAADPRLAEARGDDGVSAVLHAHYRGRPEVVEALLEAAPILDVFDAAALGRTDQLERLLDDDRSLVHAVSSDGLTALHLAAFFGHDGAARLLLERGADARAVAQNPMGVQPIHSAAARGHADLVAALLDTAADPDARQRGGWTALHSAAHHGNSALAEVLLRHGADPSLESDDGATPAALAKEAGHEQLARRLSTG